MHGRGYASWFVRRGGPCNSAGLVRSFGLGLVVLGALGGCRIVNLDVGYTCHDPDRGHLGPDGLPDPCHERDPKAGECQEGACEPVPEGWEGPWLVWHGSDGIPSTCPHDAPFAGWHYGDFIDPGGCPFCTCEPSSGLCELPTMIETSSAGCGDPAGVVTPFDAPPSWKGSCDNTAQVPAGAAMSVSIGPITIKKESCLPGPLGPGREYQAQWGTYALVCHGAGWRLCNDSKSWCVPEGDHEIAGFKLCVSQSVAPDKIDVASCGFAPFTEKHVFYDGAEDTRNCTCTCGPPQGSSCTAALSLDQDAACAAPVKQGIVIDSSGPLCVDLQSPVPGLNSKSSTKPTYHPGTCIPTESSVADGAVFPRDPWVYCCIP